MAPRYEASVYPSRLSTKTGCGRVIAASMAMIVQPWWGVTSTYQEHDHAAECTRLAPRPPGHAATLPLPVPCRYLAGLPLPGARAADGPHHAGLRARLAADHQCPVAAVLRLLPPRALVPRRLPARHDAPGLADALSRGA